MANETNKTTEESGCSHSDAMARFKSMCGLNVLAKEFHTNSVRKGFYDDPQPSVCEQLALITTEVAEAIQSDRKNKHADFEHFFKLEHDEPNFDVHFRTFIKDTVEDECADILIRLLDFCGWQGIDISSHVMLKLKYNASRPYKHGKQY